MPPQPKVQIPVQDDEEVQVIENQLSYTIISEKRKPEDFEKLFKLEIDEKGNLVELLKSKSFENCRVSKKDDNSFYRAFAFCYLEKVLSSKERYGKLFEDLIKWIGDGQKIYIPNTDLSLIPNELRQKYRNMQIHGQFIEHLQKLRQCFNNQKQIQENLLQFFNNIPEFDMGMIMLFKAKTMEQLETNSDQYAQDLEYNTQNNISNYGVEAGQIIPKILAYATKISIQIKNLEKKDLIRDISREPDEIEHFKIFLINPFKSFHIFYQEEEQEYPNNTHDSESDQESVSDSNHEIGIERPYQPQPQKIIKYLPKQNQSLISRMASILQLAFCIFLLYFYIQHTQNQLSGPYQPLNKNNQPEIKISINNQIEFPNQPKQPIFQVNKNDHTQEKNIHIERIIDFYLNEQPINGTNWENKLNQLYEEQLKRKLTNNEEKFVRRLFQSYNYHFKSNQQITQEEIKFLEDQKYEYILMQYLFAQDKSLLNMLVTKLKENLKLISEIDQMAEIVSDIYQEQIQYSQETEQYRTALFQVHSALYFRILKTQDLESFETKICQKFIEKIPQFKVHRIRCQNQEIHENL